MERPFIALSLNQFFSVLERFPFERKINAVHMHHTWRPNRAQYRGVGSIQSMYFDHTTNRGFSDIAQHITIAPDGTIWTGRDWNKPPASAIGNNGSSAVGPFMFEMIGDFDRDQDPFDDPQRSVTLSVIVAVQRHFELSPETLHFHREMSPKSCPGTGIDYVDVVAAVRSRAAQGDLSVVTTNGAPFPPSFSTDDTVVRSAIQALQFSVKSRGVTSLGEELGEKEEGVTTRDFQVANAGSVAERELSTDDLITLRSHVINSRGGQLVVGGAFCSLPEDVNRIFDEDMEKAFQNPTSEPFKMPSRNAGEPFRIMLWAHGGLIPEKDGLKIALKHLRFWKTNGIYPIYFVWETGLFDAIGHLLDHGRQGARGVTDLSDDLLERLARALGGEKVWGAMKWNAQACATPPNGGVLKIVDALKGFCDRHSNNVKLYAAGHSAGSIYHSWFLPAASAAKVQEVEALYLLAPAIRVDGFTERLLPLIGNYVKRLDVFTMFRQQELKDDCGGIYRKSLLYLIRFALEQEHGAEILGLEESIRRNPSILALFGSHGSLIVKGDLILSPSSDSDGSSASRSVHHGGFDDDCFTMNSIALRVLERGKGTKDNLAVAYVTDQTRSLDGPMWVSDEVKELRAQLPLASDYPEIEGLKASRSSQSIRTGSKTSRLKALCVGIDQYPSRANVLAGCVSDAKLWSATLTDLGFGVTLLLDSEATYSNIKKKFGELISSSKPGDILVWQYSGHGTQVPDLNGDEEDDTDEALCPVDFETGRVLIDDEIAEFIEELPKQVRLTLFMDCCHSGTLNRFGFGGPGSPDAGRDIRPRFLSLTPQQRSAYVQYAKSVRSAVLSGRTHAESRKTNEVLFTACKAEEVAYERDGQGEFTLRATRILSSKGPEITNQEFLDTVIEAFGSGRRQTPTIACADTFLADPMFEAVENVSTLASSSAGKQLKTSSPTDRFDRAAAIFEKAARDLRTV